MAHSTIVPWQFICANRLLDGEGVKQDYSKAMAYFTAAAQQGHLVAFYNLGQMQQIGLGVLPSCATAVQMYKRVAERGAWSSLIKQAYEFYLVGYFFKIKLSR